MHSMKRFIPSLIIVIVIGAVLLLILGLRKSQPLSQPEPQPQSQQATNATTTSKTVLFSCDTGKTIMATFYPTDDKAVDLVLSDKRNYSLPHAISASGARYATPDESIVFWNKGNTAFITENGTTTFSGCVTSQ